MPARPTPSTPSKAGRLKRRQPSPAPDQLTKRLLEYFRKHCRKLPWRGTDDPYAVWVSETMLQQTQVTTVIPYFLRWMRELPDLRSVAFAPLDRLLRLWAGLGYYSRPRRFQEAARLILETRAGQWPATPDQWQVLPGVGRYTAGAICSIAFNQPVPIVDGNIKRVLSRLWCLAPRARGPSLDHRLWQLAEELVQAAAAQPSRGRRNCSDLNQALMELGALICTPRQPRCESCPLQDLCLARAEGTPTRYPRLKPRSPTQRLQLRVYLLEWQGHAYLEQQTQRNWNAGLWQFPTALRADRDLQSRPLHSEAAPPPPPLFSIRHSITRHQIHAQVFHLRGRQARRAAPQSQNGGWFGWNDIPELALPSLHRKIYEQWKARCAPAAPTVR